MPHHLLPQTRVFVAGHKGLVGSALVRALARNGHENVLVADRSECDLCDQQSVNRWFREQRPEVVILAAGKVGGIHANNTYPAEFLYQNLLIHAHVIEASRQNDVSRLLYLGSSCIYPKECPQPIKEEYLLTGPLEATNEPYALAKITGIRMCDSYRRQYGCDYFSAMPTNLYGPNDNFDLENSHVLPALMRKFHEAKVEGRQDVEIWGTGEVYREFLHVDDLAEACLFLTDQFEGQGHINVGTGVDLTIRELAETMRDIVHPAANLCWNTSMPDGTKRKLMDSTKIHELGWKHRINLREGIEATYAWFLENVAESAVN